MPTIDPEITTVKEQLLRAFASVPRPAAEQIVEPGERELDREPRERLRRELAGREWSTLGANSPDAGFSLAERSSRSCSTTPAIR